MWTWMGIFPRQDRDGKGDWDDMIAMTIFPPNGLGGMIATTTCHRHGAGDMTAGTISRRRGVGDTIATTTCRRRGAGGTTATKKGTAAVAEVETISRRQGGGEAPLSTTATAAAAAVIYPRPADAKKHEAVAMLPTLRVICHPHAGLGTLNPKP
jgi:hypothetical protein